MPLTRRILTLTTLLLFSAALSTLIAWSLELRSVYSRSRFHQVSTFRLADPATPTEFIRGEIQHRFGMTVCSATRVSAGGSDPATQLPHWFTPPPPGIGETTGAMAVGFPFLCLTCDFNYQSAAGKSFRPLQYHHSISVLVPGQTAKIAFATCPLILGLLANSALYATLLAASYYALRQTRRHLRLRRGHCPFCNYDLRGQPTLCPECGRGSASPN